MRLKESLVIDGLIVERRKSLSRDNLSEDKLNQRSLALTVLIEARDKLDSITKKPAQISGRQIARSICKELRRGTSTIT